MNLTEWLSLNPGPKLISNTIVMSECVRMRHMHLDPLNITQRTNTVCCFSHSTRPAWSGTCETCTWTLWKVLWVLLSTSLRSTLSSLSTSEYSEWVHVPHPPEPDAVEKLHTLFQTVYLGMKQIFRNFLEPPISQSQAGPVLVLTGELRENPNWWASFDSTGYRGFQQSWHIIPMNLCTQRTPVQVHNPIPLCFWMCSYSRNTFPNL